MTKKEIIESLATCISLMESTDNIYVRNKLTDVAEALIQDWNETDCYVEEVRKIIGYDETMENLNNLWK